MLLSKGVSFGNDSGSTLFLKKLYFYLIQKHVVNDKREEKRVVD